MDSAGDALCRQAVMYVGKRSYNVEKIILKPAGAVDKNLVNLCTASSGSSAHCAALCSSNQIELSIARLDDKNIPACPVCSSMQTR